MFVNTNIVSAQKYEVHPMTNIHISGMIILHSFVFSEENFSSSFISIYLFLLICIKISIKLY